MRKIEQRMVEAITNGKTFSLGNTRVTALDHENKSRVYLHGNLIAVFCWRVRGKLLNKRYELVRTKCTLAGWPTVTTRSRLNAICRGLGMACRFGQKNHRQIFDNLIIESTDWVTL